MTYPWGSGDVLTAADLNAYAGLVLVKTQTVATGTGTATITNAFSSQFENYRIVLQLTPGGGGTVQMQLVGATTNYYATMSERSYTGSTADTDVNNGTYWPILTTATAFNNHASVDVYAPNLAANKSYFSSGSAGSKRFIAGGGQITPTARTGFTIEVSGTTFEGTIRVYGYNNG